MYNATVILNRRGRMNEEVKKCFGKIYLAIVVLIIVVFICVCRIISLEKSLNQLHGQVWNLSELYRNLEKQLELEDK